MSQTVHSPSLTWGKDFFTVSPCVYVQLTANQTARLPFYGVKWPFSRGRGPIVRVLTRCGLSKVLSGMIRAFK